MTGKAKRKRASNDVLIFDQNSCSFPSARRLETLGKRILLNDVRKAIIRVCNLVAVVK